MIKFNEYMIDKMNQAIIFSSNHDLWLENKELSEILLTKESLINFKNYVIECADDQILNYYTKENIYKMIDYMRFNVPFDTRTNKQEVYELCNEVLRCVNFSGDAKVLDFYMDEGLKRKAISLKEFSRLLFSERFSAKNNQEYNEMIAMDFDILLTHSEFLDHNEFTRKTVCNYLLRDYYLWSLNAIMTENSTVFSNKVFSGRVKYLLNLNEFLVLTANSCSNRFAKQNSKILKKVEKIKI